MAVTLIISGLTANARTLHTKKGKFKNAKFVNLNTNKGLLIQHSKGKTWIKFLDLKKRSDRNLFLLPDIQLADGTVYKCCNIYYVSANILIITRPFFRGKERVITIKQEDLSPYWRYKFGHTSKKTKGKPDVK